MIGGRRFVCSACGGTGFYYLRLNGDLIMEFRDFGFSEGGARLLFCGLTGPDFGGLSRADYLAVKGWLKACRVAAGDL